MATVPIPNEEERLQDVKAFTEAHNPDSTLANFGHQGVTARLCRAGLGDEVQVGRRVRASTSALVHPCPSEHPKEQLGRDPSRQIHVTTLRPSPAPPSTPECRGVCGQRPRGTCGVKPFRQGGP